MPRMLVLTGKAVKSKPSLFATLRAARGKVTSEAEGVELGIPLWEAGWPSHDSNRQ